MVAKTRGQSQLKCESRSAEDFPLARQERRHEPAASIRVKFKAALHAPDQARQSEAIERGPAIRR